MHVLFPLFGFSPHPSISVFSFCTLDRASSSINFCEREKIREKRERERERERERVKRVCITTSHTSYRFYNNNHYYYYYYY